MLETPKVDVVIGTDIWGTSQFILSPRKWVIYVNTVELHSLLDNHKKVMSLHNEH